ncbi:MAG: hypothetical protein COB13_003055 [OCS116 cluster bacterium]|nr:hypothetical protein [OCS116 cluster bacterium]
MHILNLKTNHSSEKFSQKRKLYQLGVVTALSQALVACGGDEADGQDEVPSLGIEGIEEIAGTDGDDQQTGTEGVDVFSGSEGADYIDGLGGGDFVNYTFSTKGIIAYLDGRIGKFGFAEGDILVNVANLIGSQYNDTLVGNELDNKLIGLDGDDVLIGRGGADLLDGRDGIDLADYSLSNSAVSVDLTAGTGLGGDAAGDTLASIENVTGSAFSDNLIGNEQANIMIGGAGNDALIGHDGNDKLYGNGGDDDLDGGNGDDLLVGADGDDRLYARDGDDILIGGLGSDRLDGGDGVDLADYTDSNAGIDVDLAADTASGGHAEGDDLNNIENLTGSKFDDKLAGDAGGNEINGGEGSDTINYVNSDAAVNVDLSSGTVSGGFAEGDVLTSIENITGSRFDDHLMGDSNINHFDGGDGIDTLDYSFAGARVEVDLIYGQGYFNDAEGDTLVNIENLIGSIYDDVLCGNDIGNRLDGGEGWDATTYATSTAAVNVDLFTGVTSGGFAEGDLLISIEGVIGSAFDDHLCGSEGANKIDGRDGIDSTSYYQSTAGVTINLFGETASGGHAEGDILLNIENVTGSDFNDILGGGLEANILDGGLGKDAADYSLSNAQVSVDLSNDTASGGHAENDELNNIENLIGSAFADNLTGDASDNELRGMAGNDVMTGLAGNDTLYGGAGEDALNGGDNNDALYGGADDDVLQGGSGADTLDGGEGLDQLYGNNGNDILRGGAGNDLLKGGEDDDDLFGGAGDNVLDGGTGTDKMNLIGVNNVSYVIQQVSNKIDVTYTGAVTSTDTVKSVELLVLDSGTIDFKTIWNDLDGTEQAKFGAEGAFLAWLGNDAGYNYDGL